MRGRSTLCVGSSCEQRRVRASSGCCNTQAWASPGREVVQVSKKPAVAGGVLRGSCVEHCCRAGYRLNCPLELNQCGDLAAGLCFHLGGGGGGGLGWTAQQCCAAFGCLFPVTFRPVGGFLLPHLWSSCRKLVLDELPAFS